MTDLTRRRLLAAAGGTALVSATPAVTPFFIRKARAADYPMRFANNLPLAHPMNVRAREAADAIRAQTDGQVDIEIFPNNQLGGDTDVLSQVRSGGVQFFTLSGLILSTLVPVAAINGVGFAFPDYDHVWRAMDGEVGAYVREAITDAGLIPLEKQWDNGFRQITTSTRPIETPDDLVNFKIRVPVSPLWTSMFTAFGSAPTSINFAEVYSALQTRVVEGQENPLAIVDTAKLYEVQQYCSLTNHMWDGYWMLCNRRALSDLPDEYREVVERNLNEAAVKERADIVELNGHLRADLEARQLAFNEPDPTAFRAKLQEAGFYSEWKETFGEEAWALLEKTTGTLA